jgi:hypothetical protein
MGAPFRFRRELLASLLLTLPFFLGEYMFAATLGAGFDSGPAPGKFITVAGAMPGRSLSIHVLDNTEAV